LISQVGDRCFAYAQHDKTRKADGSLALSMTIEEKKLSEALDKFSIDQSGG